MHRQHLDHAVEQFAFWRELGLDYAHMLEAIGITMREPPTAGDVVVALAEASDELERNLRWRGLNAA